MARLQVGTGTAAGGWALRTPITFRGARVIVGDGRVTDDASSSADAGHLMIR